MVEDAVPLEAVHRALVVKLRHQGDVLLASPVFTALKRKAPHVEIDALVYSETAPMLTGHPSIGEVFCIERSWKTLAPFAQASAEWKLFSQLRARRYDLILHLTEHWRGAWLSLLLGPRWAVGPKVRGRGGAWKRSFTHLVSTPLASGRHVVETNLDALRRIGIYPLPSERALTLIAGPPAEQRIAQLLAERGLAGQPFVQVHPSSRWRFKCWPAEKMAALIDRLHARGARVVLTGAPDNAEAQMIDEIQQRLANPVAANFAGALTLKELAALTAQARLFIGVDSAPMHIAAAVGTPAVAIFGPSGADLWGPWGAPRAGTHRVVAADEYTCRPCGLDGCGGGKVSDCLVTLEVERVWAAACELLETQ